VPTVFVLLAVLPLTPSGKVDRQRLPVPDPVRSGLEDPYVAPHTPLEQQVASIWSRLLHLEHISIHDSFFELGGHSLLVMQLLFRIRDATHVDVPLISFFETPTIAGLTAYIEAVQQTKQALPPSPLLPVSRDLLLPASIAQEHFWLFDQLFSSLSLFNISCVLRLEGVLNVAILEQSVSEILRRHEALRTTFTMVDGQLVQVIAPASAMTVTVRDLREQPETERAETAQRLLQQESRRPFDLARGPLLRGYLLRLDEQEHLLLITLHHISGDAWSLAIFLHELTTLYDAFATGNPSPLPALPIQYADFAYWQRQWRHHAVMQAQLTYWQEHLRDPLPVLQLPLDRPRGPGVSLGTARQALELPGTLFAAITNLSQQEGSTLFITCLAAFKMLLYGYTSQADLCVATLAANRTRPETEGMIGLFVNTLLLRTRLDGNLTCQEALQRVRATTLAAYAHQDFAFEELIRTLEYERHLKRTSLCQVLLIWQSAMLRPQQFSAQTLRFQVMEPGVRAPEAAFTTFDLILTLRERPHGITGTCVYKPDLFDAATISRMLDDFQYVLTCLSTQPEQALSIFCSLRSARG
jgi:acyl carrier protein